MRKLIAGMLIVLTFVAAPAHAASITLGCSGTIIYSGDGYERYENGRSKNTVSDLSIVVNLDQKAVTGLWEDWDESKGTTVYTPLPIIATDANSVRFEASKKNEIAGTRTSIWGTVDRITGATFASEQEISDKYKSSHTTSYDLRCRPMKPLF